jgi:hypothetical protein
MNEHPSSNVRVWRLTDEKINDLQVDSIDRLIQRANAAHYVDVRVRINGEYEWFQADWIKHIAPVVPWYRRAWLRIWCTLDDHGGIDSHGNCKRCGAKVVL